MKGHLMFSTVNLSTVHLQILARFSGCGRLQMPSRIHRLRGAKSPPVLCVEPCLLFAFGTLEFFPVVTGAAAQVLKLLQLLCW